jgi:hypothetical protein
MRAGAFKTSVNFYHTYMASHIPGHFLVTALVTSNLTLVMSAQCLISIAKTTHVEQTLDG